MRLRCDRSRQYDRKVHCSSQPGSVVQVLAKAIAAVKWIAFSGTMPRGRFVCGMQCHAPRCRRLEACSVRQGYTRRTVAVHARCSLHPAISKSFHSSAPSSPVNKNKLLTADQRKPSVSVYGSVPVMMPASSTSCPACKSLQERLAATRSVSLHASPQSVQ